MGQKKFANGFILGMALTLAVGGAGMKVYDVVEDRQNSKNAVNDESMEKAKLIEEIIDEKYTGEVDKELMEADMYKGMMVSLGDPYSAYYTAEEYEELNTETTGSYKGIGVVMQMQMDTGAVKIVRCYEGAPGEKAGLLPEDILLQNRERAKAHRSFCPFSCPPLPETKKATCSFLLRKWKLSFRS